MPKELPELETLPIREICARYDGEWLLIKILDPDAPLGDAPGQLLGRAANQKGAYRVERKVRKTEPRALLTILQGGGEQFGDGEALRRALARIKAEEDFISVNNW